MGDKGGDGFLKRVADDFRATRRYLAATATSRRLASERGKLQAELQATWLEIGDTASGAGLGSALPGYAAVPPGRERLAQAEREAEQARQAARQAQESLDEGTRKHAATIAELSAQAKQAGDAASATHGELKSATSSARTIEDRMAHLQSGLARMGPAGAADAPSSELQDRLTRLQTAKADTSSRCSKLQQQAKLQAPPTQEPPELQAARRELSQIEQEIKTVQTEIARGDMLRQLEELRQSLPAVQEKLAAARVAHDQATAAQAAKAAELSSAQAVAKEARAKGDAAVAAANAVVAQAAQAFEAAKQALSESLTRFGQSVFEAGLAGEAIDAPTVKARALRQSIVETDSQIDAARAQADAARGGTRRFMWTAGAAVACVAVVVVGVMMLVSAFSGKPRGAGSPGTPMAGNTAGTAATQPTTPVASRFAATRPAPKVFQLTQLTSSDVKPSDASQTLVWQDKVKVTLPPGLLREPGTLILSQVNDAPEPGFSCFKPLARYDVSIGKQREFDKEIEIELAVDPALVRKDVPSEAQFTAAYFDAEEHQWVEVGCQIDPAKGKATIRTKHLCLLQMWYLGINYTIVGCGPGNNMGLAWDPAEVARETKKYQRVFPNDTPGLPDFISDLREYAISARTKYHEIGLDPYSNPLWIFVTGQGSSSHGTVTKNVYVTFNQMRPETVQYVVAHEMFHNIQMSKYDMPGVLARRWWMEATAEYASSRIAIENYKRMGKTDQGAMSPKFLSIPIDHAATPRPDWWKSVFGADPYSLHAYQSAFFLEYLCKSGAALKGEAEPGITPAKYFKQLWDFVSSYGVYTLSSLDSFLIKQHGRNYTLPWQYDRFVLHFLFDFNGPMPKQLGGQVMKFRQDACEDLLEMRDTDKELPTYAFNLEGGYTAKVAGLHVKPADPSQTIGVSVELEGDLPAYTSLHVVHLPRDEHKAGGVPPVGSYQFAADSRKVFIANLAGEDGLYIVGVNTYFNSQSIRVKIRQCLLKIDSISPATTKPYAPIIIKGQGFGAQQPSNVTEGLFYGTRRLHVAPASPTTKPWTDTEIRTTAPAPPGDKFTVKLNGKTSNAFPFAAELGPWPPGDLEVRVWSIRLRHHKINLTWYLSLQVLEGGVVNCFNGHPGPPTRPLLGKGTVQPNLAGEKNQGLYIWNIPFVYTYKDYPMINGEQTEYTISAVIRPMQMTGTVTGGAMTAKPTPSGRRIIDIGKPLEPSAIPTQPANQADLSDEVWNVYDNEAAWCRVQGTLDSAGRQIKDFEQQIEELGKFTASPAPGGDVAALRTVIKLLETANTTAGKELNEVSIKASQAQRKLTELRINRLYPPAMPYDRAKADLLEMAKQLRAQRTTKEAELTEKNKQIANLQMNLDKACQAKIPASSDAADELSRLRADANRRQAALDLTRFRIAGRQKYLDELSRLVKDEQSAADALAASIKAKTADPGVPFQTMVNILPYQKQK